MNFSEVREKLDNGDYKNKLQYPGSMKYYGENHIFDENKSVKWNREEAARIKQLYETQKTAYDSENTRLNNLFEADVVSAIAEYCKISLVKAESVFAAAYSSGHSCGYSSVIEDAKELSALVYKVVN